MLSSPGCDMCISATSAGWRGLFPWLRSSQLGSQGGGGCRRAAAPPGAEHPAAALATAPARRRGAAHLLAEGQWWRAAGVLNPKAGNPSYLLFHPMVIWWLHFKGVFHRLMPPRGSNSKSGAAKDTAFILLFPWLQPHCLPWLGKGPSSSSRS